MRLEVFQNFIAVVECGTFTAAARKVNIAQPALSSQIRTLEEELGVQLLRRSTRSVEPTEAGRIFYERSKAICRIQEGLHREIRTEARSGGGTLRLAVSHSLPQSFTRQILRLTARDLPAAAFDLFRADTVSSMQMVRNGVADLAVLDLRDPLPGDLREVFSLPQQLQVLYSADHMRLSPAKGALRAADLRDIPLAADRESLPLLTRLCREEGFLPNIRCTGDSWDDLFLWAESSQAAAVTYTIPGEVRTLLSRPLADPFPVTRRAIVLKKDAVLSPVWEAFVSRARELYL